MIELPIYDSTGKKVDSLKIDEQTLGGEIRHALLKQAYVITHGNQRQGSARTKSRGDIEGSTRKLYKQKGTGNARAGAARTPIRKGGGVTFKKTSDFAKMIEAVGINRTCLVATAKSNRNAMLSARNVANVDVCRIDQLNAFDLLNHRFLVVDKASLVSFLDGSCFEAPAAKEAK